MIKYICLICLIFCFGCSNKKSNIENNNLGVSDKNPILEIDERNIVLIFPLFKELNRFVKSEKEFIKRYSQAKKIGYRVFGIFDKEKKPIAFIGVSKSFNLYWGLNYHVDTLVVSKRHRRKGYGKKLIDFLKKLSKKDKATKFSLETGLKRKVAQEFYESQNFKKVGFEFRFLNKS